MHPWQIEMLDKMSGLKKGELSIITAGRQVGKSAISAQAFQRLWRKFWFRDDADRLMFVMRWR